jgi:hypothetical protein
MLEDQLLEAAPADTALFEFRSGARPFGARAMTQPTATPPQAAPTGEEAQRAFLKVLGTPARPIRNLAELQLAVDARRAFDAAAARRREELIREFNRRPSEVLGF